jgi:hypothetical protein
MSTTPRRRLAVVASGVLTALIAGIPSFAEKAPAGPALEFAAATCSAAGELEVEFTLAGPVGAASIVTAVGVQVASQPEPLPAAALAGTLRPGAELPDAGALSGAAIVPPRGGPVVFTAELGSAAGESTELRAETVLEPCEPVVPDEELEVPGRVWGPYGGKRTIPTHVSPTGGQTTHPSVVRIPGGWNGFEYWMAHTPYPGSNSGYEDPNIVASHDGVTWVVPPGLTNPIDDQPGLPGPYNSDTDLTMGPGNTMYVFWRVVIPDATQERIKYSSSTDGVHWSAPGEAFRNSMSVRRPLSPAFLYEDGRWTMWTVNITRSPNRVEYAVGGATPTRALWGPPVAVEVGTMQKDKEPWHLSMTKDGDEYIGLLNDTVIGSTGRDGDLLFLAGETPTAFLNSAKSTVPRTKPFQHDHLYRATMLVGSEYGKPGYRMWYSARMALNPDVWNVQDTFLHGADVHGAP